MQHADEEGPGLIGDEMGARGLAFSTVAASRGERLPRAEEIAGLISMGGPMGVYEADRYPFLAAEMELMAALVRAGRPVLGVCLGAQLLAAALGAAVVRGPVAEVGAGTVTLTAAGRADPVLGGGPGASVPVLHWHQDTFALPAGALQLARSEHYEQQAFRWGRDAYGLQFHIEVDAELAAQWAPLLPAQVSLGAAEVERAAAFGRAAIGRYLELVCGERVRGRAGAPAPGS